MDCASLILPQTIVDKLKKGGWDISDLPIIGDRSDTESWNDVKTECSLTNAELSRLKNFRCVCKAALLSPEAISPRSRPLTSTATVTPSYTIPTGYLCSYSFVREYAPNEKIEIHHIDCVTSRRSLIASPSASFVNFQDVLARCKADSIDKAQGEVNPTYMCMNGDTGFCTSRGHEINSPHLNLAGAPAQAQASIYFQGCNIMNAMDAARNVLNSQLNRDSPEGKVRYGNEGKIILEQRIGAYAQFHGFDHPEAVFTHSQLISFTRSEFEFTFGDVDSNKYMINSVKEPQFIARINMLRHDRSLPYYEFVSSTPLPVSGYGRVVHPCSGVYEGELKDSTEHGKGCFSYLNGDIYRGEFKQGKASGEGNFIYTNGDIYVGPFKDDMEHGRGKLITANGNIFQGEWNNGKMPNQGKIIYVNGNIFEGEWKNYMGHGQGKIIYGNGNIYEGEFKDDKRNGQGKYTFVFGGFSEGEWHDDMLTGQGRQFTVESYILEGEFRNGALYNGTRTQRIHNGQILTSIIDDSTKNSSGISSATRKRKNLS